VVFNIVDIGPKKDIILGRLWYRNYNPNIDWKGGGHLQPRKSPYPTNTIGNIGQELQQGSVLRIAPP
jgi:hypothetical protein